MRLSLKLKRKPNPEVMRQAWLKYGEDVLKRIGARHVREREIRTTTWRKRPQFAAQTGTATYRVSLVIFFPAPSAKESDIWQWLDKGTSIRYATMSSDFQAKTAPGRVRPRAGKGGRLFVSKWFAKPGIKARNFERDIINKLRQPTLQGLETAMKRAFKRKRF